MKGKATHIVIVTLAVFALAALWAADAQAAGGMVKGPNVIAPDRYVYYPGTEKLAKGEVRIIAWTSVPVRCATSIR
jgi:hypothetical protein